MKLINLRRKENRSGDGLDDYLMGPTSEVLRCTEQAVMERKCHLTEALLGKHEQGRNAYRDPRDNSSWGMWTGVVPAQKFL